MRVPCHPCSCFIGDPDYRTKVDTPLRALHQAFQRGVIPIEVSTPAIAEPRRLMPLPRCAAVRCRTARSYSMCALGNIAVRRAVMSRQRRTPNSSYLPVRGAIASEPSSAETASASPPPELRSLACCADHAFNTWCTMQGVLVAKRDGYYQ